MYKTLFIFILLSVLFNGSRANDLSGLTAQSWLVADGSGNILNGVNISEIRSIASITKLMTVMIVLDSQQSLDEVIPKKLYNKQLNRQTLIDLAIVKSDNNAAKILCEYYPSGYDACINAMNEKAKLLHMNNTFFTDPTGLLSTNVSTAEDLIKLVHSASTYNVIVDASNKTVLKYHTNNKKFVQAYNTNPIVGTGIYFLVSKTGFISKSGGCIVMMLETFKGLRTIIILGSKNTKTRIPEARLLSNLF